MILRQNVAQVAAALRHSTPGIRRVALAHADGEPFADDLTVGDPATDDPAADPVRFAALAAATVELAQRSSAVGGLGGVAAVTVRGPDSTLLVTPVGAAWVLAVVAEPQVNLVLLDRILGRQVEHLIGLDGG